jgi:Family of unknown function (DUF6152)
MKIGNHGLSFAAIFVPLICSAHHAVSGRFDMNGDMEISGVVTSVSWRNPHVQITIETQDGVSWELETNGLTSLQRSGIPANAVQIGDLIRVAGDPPRTSAREIFATNILLPSGEELLLTARPNAGPRWAEGQTLGDSGWTRETEGDTSRPELGIFRVWSGTVESPQELNRKDPSEYQLTVAGLAALQRFNPATDSPIRGCRPKGMPTIMDQPFPIEFVDNGDEILLRIEEYDTQRLIHMDRDSPPPGELRSLLGYSVGRWDGDSLVVTTSLIDWPFFNQRGIPQSQNAELVERFTPTADGSRLDYLLTANDAPVFVEPASVSGYWLYIPDAKVLPFDCFRLEQ